MAAKAAMHVSTGSKALTRRDGARRNIERIQVRNPTRGLGENGGRADTPGAGPVRGAHVLLADNSRAMRRMMATFLSGLGARVKQAKDGRAALEQLQDAFLRGRPFDLLVAGAKIRRLGGLELLRAVRSDPHISQTPAIIVSAAGDKEMIRLFAGLGISGYLLTPIQTRALRACVTDALAGAAARAGHAPADGEAPTLDVTPFIVPPSQEGMSDGVAAELRDLVIRAAAEAIASGSSRAATPEEDPVAEAVLAWLSRRTSSDEDPGDDVVRI